MLAWKAHVEGSGAVGCPRGLWGEVRVWVQTHPSWHVLRALNLLFNGCLGGKRSPGNPLSCILVSEGELQAGWGGAVQKGLRGQWFGAGAGEMQVGHQRARSRLPRAVAEFLSLETAKV